MLTRRECDTQLICPKGLRKEKWDEKSLSYYSMKGSWSGRSDGKTPTREIPVTLPEREGFATARPEAALVTETAGVSTPSAMVNPVAKRH